MPTTLSVVNGVSNGWPSRVSCKPAGSVSRVRATTFGRTSTKALDEAHVPYFVTEFEERMSGFDQLQIQLETFVENILFD